MFIKEGTQIDFSVLPLFEDKTEKDIMTDAEKHFHKKLVKLLKDDGKGHHHAMYAKVLKQYPLTIVPLGKQPATAAISYDEKMIYINQGFLTDPEVFGQLNVIIRHELLHNLLMHQVRMIKKLSTDIPEANLRLSSSIHEICNVLEDFEISNKKYSSEDKEMVRNTWINGKIISGLVTEDHRSSWAGLPLEDMWDKFMAEMAKYNYEGETDWRNQKRYDADTGAKKGAIPSNIEMSAANLVSYKKYNTASDFDTIEEFYNYIMKPAWKRDPNETMPKPWQDIFDGLKKIEDDPDNGYDANDIVLMMQNIAKSKPISKVDIESPVTGEIFCTVYSPEEKQIAEEILKIIVGNTAYNSDYSKWYEEIMRIAKEENLTEDEIKDLLSALN